MKPIRTVCSASALTATGMRLPLLLGAVISLLGSAAPPAQAVSGTISTPTIGPITVGPGETLTIVAGGSVTANGPGENAVTVNGGTLLISGGAVIGANSGLRVAGGTATLSSGFVRGGGSGAQVNPGTFIVSGGSVQGDSGVVLNGGALNLSGGAVSGFSIGVEVHGGMATLAGGAVTGGLEGLVVTAGSVLITGGAIAGEEFYDIGVDVPGTTTVSGTCLKRDGENLTGVLQDGTPINLSVRGPITLDSQPVITCPPGKIVTASPGSCSAIVPLDPPQAGDDCSTVAGSRSDGQPLTAPYPVGTTTLTWTATDPAGNQATCTQTVTVRDAQPPVISGASASPNTLWPPLLQRVPVTINYTLTDPCSAASASLSVSSNEPVTGLLDLTSPDWEIIDAHHVRLRAERRLVGSGRVYTITITATDSSGNKSSQAVTVRVPLLPGG